jgi:hypothetical protein
MKYILMDYVNEAGWAQLTRDEQLHWLGAYRAHMEAMMKAGVLKNSSGLQRTAAATTVRVLNGKTQVLDGPYADTKERSGTFTSSRCPTSMPQSRGRLAPRPHCTASSKWVHSWRARC